MLQFLGLGSAFNTNLGNTSAFIKKDDSMCLIDCGGTVFHKLNEHQLLKEIKHLHIIITHTHPDHIGSLGEVIFYAHFILKIQVTIYYPEVGLISTLLSCLGVQSHMYELSGERHVHIFDRNLGELDITFIAVPHLDTVKSYGFLCNYNNKRFYYSGDANAIPAGILNLIETNDLDRLYQDTCGLEYEGNAHLSLNQLTEAIPMQFRKNVYCIHLDQHINFDAVKALGFQIPSIYT